MRFIMLIVFVAACLFATAYGVFGTSAASSVLGAIWTLIAVVALIGRGVLDALHRLGGVPAEPGREPGDRGGAGMPSWLK